MINFRNLSVDDWFFGILWIVCTAGLFVSMFHYENIKQTDLSVVPQVQDTDNNLLDTCDQMDSASLDSDS